MKFQLCRLSHHCKISHLRWNWIQLNKSFFALRASGRIFLQFCRYTGKTRVWARLSSKKSLAFSPSFLFLHTVLCVITVRCFTIVTAWQSVTTVIMSDGSCEHLQRQSSAEVPQCRQSLCSFTSEISITLALLHLLSFWAAPSETACNKSDQIFMSEAASPRVLLSPRLLAKSPAVHQPSPGLASHRDPQEGIPASKMSGFEEGVQ